MVDMPGYTQDQCHEGRPGRSLFDITMEEEPMGEPPQQPQGQRVRRRQYRGSASPATTASDESSGRTRKIFSSESNKTSSRSSTGDSGSASSSSSRRQQRRRSSASTVPPKKTAHNMIEKRYRTNLNDKIAALRDSVPSLRVAAQWVENPNSEDGHDEVVQVKEEDLAGLTPAHKLNKATILSKATEYITQRERRNKALAKENAALRRRMEGYEILAKKSDGDIDKDSPDW